MRCLRQQIILRQSAWMVIALAIFCCVNGVSAERQRENEQTSKPATYKISGYGLFGDRELKRLLQTLGVAGREREFYGANFIEDSVLVLMSRLHRDGFLNARITVALRLADGRRVQYAFRESIDEPLPRDLRAKSVEFKIKEGVLYHYKKLEFAGLKSITEKRARSFFIETEPVLAFKSHRRYTPERLQRGLESITDELARRGYGQATATATNLSIHHDAGAVEVRIEVEEGVKSVVRTVREEICFADDTAPSRMETHRYSRAYSASWEQDYMQSVKTNFYHRGYPDASVRMEIVRRENQDDVSRVDLLATIHTGPRVRVNEVIFKGEKKTKEDAMRSRVRIEEGAWLDRIQAERGRYRLSQLGIFDSVTLNYEPVTAQSRNVIYDVHEGKRTDVSLLFGFGSYELLRAGIEAEQYNLWGLAHHQRLRAVQSFKASTADYTYTMPEFFGRDVDLFFNGFGLLREEVSFTREEYGGGVGVRKNFLPIATDVSVRYSYQVLNAAETRGSFASEGLTNSAVGVIITDIRHDRRDNPLYPRRGYKLFGNLEIASDVLGGEANYQKIELSSSYHQRIADGNWLHFGLSYGAIFTMSGSEDDLPFNKRFFPGGDNSIRGFQEGEASPRNEEGKFVGAETYLLGSVEYEVALSSKWSLVLFSDSLGEGRKLTDSPFDETLFSVGGGLRWRTLIGPVRVEYGYNLNPRPRDPTGAVHFSLGFPF